MNNKILKLIFSVFLALLIFCIITFIGITDIISNVFDLFKLKTIDIINDNRIKNEKIININTINDLYGIWKNNTKDFNNRYEAIIDKDSITLYRYDNGIKNIYWIGDFNIENIIYDVNKEYTIVSKNFKYVSMRIDKAATVDSKKFIYNNKCISFISQYDDNYENINLYRYKEYEDRLRVIKYSNNRESKYDDKTNLNIDLGDYTITYPYYFDTEEDILKNIINENSIPYNNEQYNIKTLNNDIVLSPSDNNSYAELYISEIKYVNFNDVDDFNNYIKNTYNYYNNKLLITKRELYADNIITNELICSIKNMNYNDYICGMSFETYLWMQKTNSLLIVGIAYQYNDTSIYDYIKDYKKIIKNIKSNY